MTPEEAIATNESLAIARGWKHFPDGPWQSQWVDTDGNLHERPPNCAGDLNEMEKAEIELFGPANDTSGDAGHIRYRYADNLYKVVVPIIAQPFRATAAQRAEAAMMTLGLW